MSERLMGLETEYALSVPPELEPASSRASLVAELIRLASRRLDHLPGASGIGIFLSNGARFYGDTGGHPEWCTPEVDNPFDLVRYVEAGHLFLASVLEELGRNAGCRPVFVTRCNVDYSGNHTTWACHENYGHRIVAGSLAEQLVPHLVSRIIYTGAGGLNPLAPGIEFCLSPRACHLVQVTSTCSTSDRGIFHFKDESLASRDWRRLHLLCGESACSHLSTFLKVGVTGLLVALVEARLNPGHAVWLRRPLEALAAFNRDPLSRATAQLRSGDSVTAVDIQTHYLAFAEAHLDHPAMPSWAAAVCRLWRETLAALRQGPASVQDRLDWAVKWSLLDQHLAARGYARHAIDTWNVVLEELRRQQRQLGNGTPLTPASILKSGGPFAGAIRQLEPVLRLNGLSWDDLPAFFKLRAQLCEIDTRFGQLGDAGLFSSLDAAGLLAHTIDGLSPESIRQAMIRPPSRGRARVRADCISRLASQARELACDWDGIWNVARAERLDLSDPFIEAAPDWKHPPRPTRAQPTTTPTELLTQAGDEYERGAYSRAYELVAALAAQGPQAIASVEPEYVRTRFWIQCRRGRLDEALALLERRNAIGLTPLTWIGDHVAAYRFASLAPQEAIWNWINLGNTLINARQPGPELDQVCFLEHQGRACLAAGQVSAARDCLQRAVALAESSRQPPRVRARTCADLADALRRLGDRAGAEAQLATAADIQNHRHYEGDHADFTLVNLVKLNYDQEDVAPLLQRAQAIQQRSVSPVGLARTLLLRARICPGNRAQLYRLHRQLRVLQLVTPGLCQCPLLTRIMTHWDAWVHGALLDDQPPDFFWGL